MVMSHREWMKLTDGGTFSSRSSELKALDSALLNFEQLRSDRAREALNAALHRWINAKGANWKTSVRNRHNAVETLFRQLGPAATLAVKPDRIALSQARDESRAILTDLFQGKQLVFRPGLLNKIAGHANLAKVSATYAVGGTANDARKLYKQLTPAAPGAARQMANALLDDIIPPEIRGEVMQAMASIMPDFLGELAAACAPFVGVAVSGAMTVVNLGKVARSEYRLDRSKMHAERSLSADDPAAAFAAITRMLQREANQNIADFTVGLSAFAAKLATLLADGGTVSNTAISLTNGLIKLMMLARIVVRDVMERNAANRLLLLPVVDAGLFDACPVMGAYLVVCAPTSVLVNTVLDPATFGQPGMMDKVERAVQHHIAPLQLQARRLVTEHRMYIVELQNFAGLVARNDKKLKDMRANVGKSGMEGFGSASA